jgi:hypothetical protein
MPFVMQIDAWDIVAAAPVTLRAASVDDPAVCHLNGEVWWPSIDRLPTLAMDFFGGEFGRVTTPASSFSLAVEHWPNFGRYSFADARLRLWHGLDGAVWAGYTLRFDGRITAVAQGEDGRAEIGFAVDDKWLDQPLLATYAGTGGIEGPAALKGRVKPLAMGQPMGVPGVLLDTVKSITQLSGYGAIESVDVPLERLARQFGSPVADHADYAAIAAAPVAAGTWVTAKAIGCVRMGAPPYGKLCFLMKGDNGGTGGWVRRPGAIIKRIAEIAGGLSKVHAASMTALDAARPYDLSVYQDSQITARTLIQSIAASVNAVAGVTLTGQLFVIPIQINAAGLTLKADGTGLPAVAALKKLGNSAPWWRQAIGARPFWDVHGDNEILKLTPDALAADIGAATVTALAAVQTLALGKSTLFYQDTAPTVEESAEHDRWFQLGTDNVYRRIAGDGVLMIGIDPITIGGDTIIVPVWTPVEDTRVDAALAAAVGAQGTADGKARVFRQYTQPTAEGIGDLWEILQADGVISTGIVQRWSGSQWANHSSLGAPTGTQVAGRLAEAVTAASINFDARNDRLATALVVPVVAADSTAVDHVLHPNGSADISFEWAWSGAEADIDGFEIVARGSTSNGIYTPDATASGELLYQFPANKRAFVIYGVQPTLYWTFAVRAFRIVDPDITAAGVIRTVWVKSAFAAENPYQPSTSTAFNGDVTGTIAGTDATTAMTKLTGIQPLADVTSLNAPSVSVPPAITINANSSGTITDALPLVLGVSRKLGDTNVDATTTWSATFPGAVTGTIDNTSNDANRGNITITNCTGSGYVGDIVITSTRDGLSLINKIAITKTLAPAPTGGGAGSTWADISNWVSVGSNTYGTVHGGPVIVNAGSTGIITVSGSLSFKVPTATGIGSYGLALKAQWRVVGGSWADIAAEVVDSGVCAVYSEPPLVSDPGSIGFYFSKTGLTSGTDYEFQILARREAPNATVGNRNITGTANVRRG